MFDFDGLIADTETPEYESWCAEFREQGVELDIDEWIKCVGAGPLAWDVYDHLESLLGRSYDRNEVLARRRERFVSLTQQIEVLPGIAELLEEARSESVSCAVASSSESGWVHGYLERFGLTEMFETVVTRDMVTSPKPAPDLYIEACRRMGVVGDTAVALEDSANGITSAQSAGIYCIAVPNRITSRFDLGHANYRASSVQDVDLATIRGLLASEPSRAQS